MKPKVSVVMPAYNQEKYIGEAIKSILTQTMTDFELIIIDDCSTDKTVEAIRHYDDKRIKIIILDSKCNIPKIRNIGIEIATGEYIAHMDSDDISLPDRLRKEVHILDHNPDVDIVGSFYQMFGEKEKLICLPTENDEIIAGLPFRCQIGNGTVMYRSDKIKRNKLYHDEKYEVCSDYKFWVDLMAYCRFSNIPEPLIKYRISSDNITNTSTKKYPEERHQILKRIRATALRNLGYDITGDDENTFASIIDYRNSSPLTEKELQFIDKLFSKTIANEQIDYFFKNNLQKCIDNHNDR